MSVNVNQDNKEIHLPIYVKMFSSAVPSQDFVAMVGVLTQIQDMYAGAPLVMKSLLMAHNVSLHSWAAVIETSTLEASAAILCTNEFL
jgi:hypothetical protein